MTTEERERKIRYRLDFSTTILFTTSIGVRFKSGAWINLQALPHNCLDQAKLLSEQDGVEIVYLSPIGNGYNMWNWYAPAKKSRSQTRNHKAAKVAA